VSAVVAQPGRPDVVLSDDEGRALRMLLAVFPGSVVVEGE